MGTVLKVLLALAGFMILAGIFLILVAAIKYKIWTDSPPDSEPLFTPNTLHYSAGEVSSLVVEDHSAHIHLMPSEDGQIRIELQEDETNPYRISLSDGKLEIKHPARRVAFRFLSINIHRELYASKELFVYLPPSFGDTSISGTNGDIHVKELAFTNLSLTTVNGGISASHVQVSGTSSSSQVNFQAKTVNGGITIDQSGAADGVVSLSTVNGGITFNGLLGQNISANTVSGSIKGVVSGNPEDYIIDSSTINGRKEIPRSGHGPNLLKVKTVNGSIDVDIRPQSESASPTQSANGQ